MGGIGESPSYELHEEMQRKDEDRVNSKTENVHGLIQSFPK